MSSDAQYTSDNESGTPLPSSAPRPRHTLVTNGKDSDDDGHHHHGVSSASIDSDDMPLVSVRSPLSTH
jgi:hypothetical protein